MLIFPLILLMAAGELRADSVTPAAVLQELKSFDQFGSVLYVAAHPDDENTALIAYLARGRNYRTAYLSITRGDGGQNVLGPELGPELGVLRTQELLAARRLDGGRQFFSRAIDFGFSKDYRQTLKVWDKQEVLSDIVRVIRTFRPDVIVTRFTTIPGNTHGHHTASAILALEAFKLSGDPSAFPDQLSTLKPWQAKRIFSNGFGIGLGGGGATSRPAGEVVRMNISGTDLVSGLSFAELAGKSRSMHKTQGFGNFVGGPGRGGGRAEAFQLLAGEPASTDIMDGVDTTWGRVYLPQIGELTDKLIAGFNSQDISANVPALLEIKKQLSAAPADPIVDEKRQLLDHVLAQCLGLDIQTSADRAEIVPGESFSLNQQVTLNSSTEVKWVAVRFPNVGGEMQLPDIVLGKGTSSSKVTTQTLPASTPISQPYWLRQPGTRGMFRVDDPTLIGRPENPPIFPVEYVFDVGGQTLVVPDEPVAANSAGEKFPRRLQAIPPVALKFASGVQLFAPASEHSVTIHVTAYRPDRVGTLSLLAPAGWKITPESQPFHLSTVGNQVDLTFSVTAPTDLGNATISADANVGGAHFNSERIEIQYSHLPFVLLQPPAHLTAVTLDLKVHAHNIGYVAGAGDDTADALRQMGCSVTNLESNDFAPERLETFDAIVIGIRAYNLRSDLAAHIKDIFAYVENGGTVVSQYNRPDGLKTHTIAPFDLTLSQQRVTDPNAEMTFLAPDHPALKLPNKITQDDFANWVQERGTYFPNHWDDHFTPILACSDAGEQPLKGSLLIAQDGKGYFVYTGLTFFRQLPAGVPGAYRLMANLISLGK